MRIKWDNTHWPIYLLKPQYHSCSTHIHTHTCIHKNSVLTCRQSSRLALDNERQQRHVTASPAVVLGFDFADTSAGSSLNTASGQEAAVIPASGFLRFLPLPDSLKAVSSLIFTFQCIQRLCKPPIFHIKSIPAGCGVTRALIHGPWSQI